MSSGEEGDEERGGGLGIGRWKVEEDKGWSKKVREPKTHIGDSQGR